ncbi:DUF4267 domain-containing protein [Nocardia sp. XZ_19_385]|uniref:DUF4267 domain-containing protein n=1 Tax=Nocardia sp. XZ_19_385 TaxID=2769488 RepID=UPI00188DCAFF|nr:DUF4267 domain-containing protein [Nocardia sp. XZ_19_385]
MLTPIAVGLAVLLDLLIIFIGLRFFLVPDAAASAFGVPASSAGDAGAFLTVKGLRDITSGVIGLAVLAFAGAHPAGLAMLAVALTPLGDTVIVLRNGGTKAVAFGIHFATAVVVLISAALLLAA